MGLDGSRTRSKRDSSEGETAKIGETSSPTIATTSIFLLAQIAAAEQRTVITLDIGSAYLNARMPKKDPNKLVFMRIA